MQSRVFWIPLLALLLAPLHAAPADTEDPASAAERKDAAREREAAAEEDPLKKRQADRVDRPAEWSTEPSGVDLYGSVRLNYRFSDLDNAASDGGSRVGVDAKWQGWPGTWLFGRVEAGFNILDTLDWVFKPGNRPQDARDQVLFPRLYYAGVETPDLIATLGKNWSTYYQVSGFTDLFDSTGGSASGTYNAGTDGGPTGTGRADMTLQSRFLADWFPDSTGLKPFHVNVQLQYGQDIPKVTGVEYGTALGLSGIVKTKDDTEVGLALNVAEVRDTDRAELVAANLDGNARAIALGIRQFSDQWYWATTIARLRNHETTDQGRYFDGWGWEVYGRHHLAGRLWAVGGWNWLQPDSGQPQARNYRVKYAVLGLRYSLKKFQRLVYLEARLDDSRLEDGSTVGNSYVVGVRWDLP